MKIFDSIISKNKDQLVEEIEKHSVNLIDKDTGLTPLHYCAQEQNFDFAKLLIDAGANVNAKDINGNTPLFKAVYFSNGKTQIIKLLLDSGADPDIKNNYDVSARQLAERIASFDVKECFSTKST